MGKKTKFSYNPSLDVLRVMKNGKIKESLDLGKIFIDFSPEWKIIGIEILDASKVLGLPKSSLKGMKNVKMKTLYGNMYVTIILYMLIHGKEQRVSLPLVLEKPLPS